MASQRLATSQNIPNRINRKVQHASNMFKHHQSSNIFTTCSPYQSKIDENCPKSTAKLSGMKVRENRKITAQGSAKNGTMNVHGHLRGSLCSDSLEHLGTSKSSPKEEWRTVRLSHYQKSAEIIRDSSIEKRETERNRTGEGHISDNQAWFRSRFRQVCVSQHLQVDSGILRHAPATC